MVELTIVIKVYHFVAVVAARHIHYPLMLRPIRANRQVTLFQWLELVVGNLWIPLWHMLLSVNYGDEVLQFIIFVKL